MTIEKNNWADVQDGVTQGLAAAELVNNNKRAVNEVIDVVNGLGTASLMTNASGGDTLGTASTKNVATDAQALAGTVNVLTDAAGAHAAFKQFGLGSTIPNLNINNGTNLKTTFFAASPANGSPIGSSVYGVQIAATQNLATRFFGRNSIMYAQSVEAGTVSPVLLLRHSGNTTVDVNGFIKSASPIVKLHSDRIEKNGDFEADFERIDTGHYLIKKHAWLCSRRLVHRNPERCQW